MNIIATASALLLLTTLSGHAWADNSPGSQPLSPTSGMTITLTEIPPYLCIYESKYYSEGSSIDLPAGTRVCGRPLLANRTVSGERVSWLPK